jgi:S-DNA-T family DNA segregation ATPase FtsK/SpoIIIE
MDLRWTVIDPSRTGAALDVRVRAPRGTTLDAVHDALHAAVGARAGPSTLRVDGVPVARTSVLGLPPLLNGSVVLTGDPPPEFQPAATTAVGLLELHVVSGPDAGGVVPLEPGRWSVGRSPEARVRVADLHLSRVHLELDVGIDGVRIRDAGSTNGTWMGGDAVGREFRPLPADTPIRAGHSTLLLRPPTGRPAVARPDGRGHLLVNRPPRIGSPDAPVEVDYPPPPPALRGTKLPWPAMFLPLLVSVPLALWWRQPAFLLFAAMTPVMMLGQYLADRRGRRREQVIRQAAYDREVAELNDGVRLALDRDLERLESEAADLARIAAVAAAPEDSLWARRPLADRRLDVRLGRGTRPSRVVVRRPPPAGSGVSTRTRETVPQHADAPVTVDLDAARVFGIAGPRPAAVALARSLVGQLAVTCSPAELTLTVLAAGAEQACDWAWTSWLPHNADDIDPAADAAATGVRHVVLVDGVRLLRERPHVAALLRDGVARDVAVICVDDDPGKLPLECRATLVVADATVGSWRLGTWQGLLRRGGAPPVVVALDLAGPAWSDALARALARLRDATPAKHDAIPDGVSLLDLLRRTGFDPTHVSDVEALWRGPDATSGAASIVGVDASGPVTFDLRRDGPHALVGGMTGSGKSELLRTLVFGLAISHPPDTVSFVLVDYKGGAAFGGCRELPHVAGLVTDLDNRLAARALTSLRAELRRRERLMATAQAVDLDDYGRRRSALRPATGSPALPALPRLVVVVDEFRVLAEELPDFVSGLVRIAAVGRSLGVHLVLATQRPAGIVSSDIQANTNLRVALRLRDRSDSEDVVDSPQAADLPADRPGRAIFRAGGTAPVEFQTALVSGGASCRPTVTPLRPVHGLSVPPAAGTAVEPAEGDEVAAVLRAVTEAATRRGVQGAPAPWLPPLPAHLDLVDAVTHVAGGNQRDERDTFHSGGTVTNGLLFGLADDPSNQRYVAARWRLGGRHLAVAGGPRSGRTTVLRTLAASALDGGETHVYGIDGAAGLQGLEDLPHVGAVVAASDVERCDRLLRMLTAVTERRRSGAEPPGRPAVLLFADGWEAIAEAWLPYDHGRLVDVLLQVLRDGGSAGVHVAVSGDRTVLTGAPSSYLSERLLLRFADPLTATLAGVPTSRLPRDPPPGRGFWLPVGGDPLEVQVATAVHPPPGLPLRRPAPLVPALPDRVGRDALDIGPQTVPDARRRCLLLGVGVGDRTSDDGSGLSPVWLEIPQGSTVPVLGPPGSGRTTTLLVLAAEAERAGYDAVLLTSGGQHTGALPAGVQVVDATADGAGALLTRALAASHEPVVLVDDADSIPESLATRVQAASAAASVVLAATAGAVTSTYGGLLGSVRGARSGLVLGAVRPGDGEVFGLRLGPAPAGPVGRGRLVTRGRGLPVQVLSPPDGSGNSSQREDGVPSRVSASASTRHVVQSCCGSAPRER